MKKKIRTWYIYLRNQLLRLKKHTSLQGQYCAYYLLDKYFLGTNTDNYIQQYENIVENMIETLMIRSNIFVQFQMQPTRAVAAFFVLVRLVFFAPKNMRETIYEYGKDWKDIQILYQYVTRGIII